MDADKQPASRPASRPAVFDRLPVEVLLPIIGHLDSVEDLSAITRVSRRLHFLFVDRLIGTHINKSADPAVGVLELFLHAANHDSATIISGLLENHRDALDICGTLPLAGLEENSFLDFALAVDAPKVAAHLLRAGANMDNGSTAKGARYPDQAQLALVLARARSTSQWELDSALRIACSYALPRTTRLLLTRGADPNSVGSLGSTAIHMAVVKREKHALLTKTQPYTGARPTWKNGRLELDPGVTLDKHQRWVELMAWQAYIEKERAISKWEDREREPGQTSNSPPFSVPRDVCVALGSGHESSLPSKPFFIPFTPEHFLWEEKLVDTVSALLDFGAYALIPREISTRMHKCSNKCWRSIDCEQRGQTAMHLAAASGLPDVISLLITRIDADPFTANADGYSPLYTAIANGEIETALFLLEFYDPTEPNPVVATTNTGTTTSALHAAARFAFSPIITAILDRNTDPNTLDAHGRTPMHELLANECPTREVEVVASLKALCAGNVRIDVHIEGPHDTKNKNQKKLDTPQEMGRKHPLELVRKMFFEVTAYRMRRFRVGPTAEEMKQERLIKEGKVRRQCWGDDSDYDVRLYGENAEAEADFPVLGPPKAKVDLKKGSWGKPPSVPGLGAHRNGGGQAFPSLSAGSASGSNGTVGRQVGGGQGPGSWGKPLPASNGNSKGGRVKSPVINTNTSTVGDTNNWSTTSQASAGSSNGARQNGFPSQGPASRTSKADQNGRVGGGQAAAAWNKNKPLAVTNENTNGGPSQSFPSLTLTPKPGASSNGGTGAAGNGSWAAIVSNSRAAKATPVVGIRHSRADSSGSPAKR